MNFKIFIDEEELLDKSQHSRNIQAFGKALLAMGTSRGDKVWYHSFNYDNSLGQDRYVEKPKPYHNEPLLVDSITRVVEQGWNGVANGVVTYRLKISNTN